VYLGVIVVVTRLAADADLAIGELLSG